MENIINANELDFGHIGWKYYNQIRKKAMEQEFSWSGLALSLSIAFFIVIASSLMLSLLYKSLENVSVIDKFQPIKIYRLEGAPGSSANDFLQIELISETKMKAVRSLNLV